MVKRQHCNPDNPLCAYVPASDYDALAARLADVDARLTDAIAKHGEVARKYGESLARLAEAEEVLDSFSACPHLGNCRNCRDKLAAYIRGRRATDSASGSPDERG